MINTISDNNFYSEVKDINQDYNEIGITSTQFYGVLFALTTVLIFALVFIYLLLKNFLNKSCAGCKRLKKCEQDIKEIKQEIISSKILDFDVFKNISDKLDDIKEDLQNG